MVTPRCYRRRIRIMKRIFPAILLLALPGLALAAAPAPVTQQEIGHLFGYLKTSGCEFNRNGSWHTGEEAVAHLNKKYDYLARRGLVTTAEDFIERAASQSSMSGKPYLVKCGASPQAHSGAWFRAELAKYRNGKAQAR